MLKTLKDEGLISLGNNELMYRPVHLNKYLVITSKKTKSYK
jgi:hypothetical protein